MKRTITKITAIHYCKAGRGYEATYSFIRSYSAKKPTFKGAARMVATLFNISRFDESQPITKPSDISVIRIEFCDYASR
jgi:hypothetical protein